MPPSMKRISLCSSIRSSRFSLFPAMPRQVTPNAHPAAREYPSLSKHRSVLGLLPICERVISVIVLLQEPLWINPIPINADVWTLIGISMSTVEGRTWMIRVWEMYCSHREILDAETPRSKAIEVSSLLGFRYW